MTEIIAILLMCISCVYVGYKIAKSTFEDETAILAIIQLMEEKKNGN